jgi:hypothetical protein
MVFEGFLRVFWWFYERLIWFFWGFFLWYRIVIWIFLEYRSHLSEFSSHVAKSISHLAVFYQVFRGFLRFFIVFWVYWWFLRVFWEVLLWCHLPENSSNFLGSILGCIGYANYNVLFVNRLFHRYRKRQKNVFDFIAIGVCFEISLNLQFTFVYKKSHTSNKAKPFLG